MRPWHCSGPPPDGGALHDGEGRYDDYASAQLLCSRLLQLMPDADDSDDALPDLIITSASDASDDAVADLPTPTTSNDAQAAAVAPSHPPSNPLAINAAVSQGAMMTTPSAASSTTLGPRVARARATAPSTSSTSNDAPADAVSPSHPPHNPLAINAAVSQGATTMTTPRDATSTTMDHVEPGGHNRTAHAAVAHEAPLRARLRGLQPAARATPRRRSKRKKKPPAT